MSLTGCCEALGRSGADAIGVNNRDLKTFNVRLETSLELVARIPAETGARNRERHRHARPMWRGCAKPAIRHFSSAKASCARPIPARRSAELFGWTFRRRDEPLDQNLRQHLAGRRQAGRRRGS